MKPNRATFHGLEVNVPSNEVEFLINMAHVNYEKLSIDITDLIHIYRLADRINWHSRMLSTIQEQVRKYHWKKSFERTVKLLDNIHWKLYAVPSPFKSLISNQHKESATCPELPISLPRSHIISSFIERKVVTYILKKALKSFSKSIRLTVTGQTYDAQGKIPSELKIFQKVCAKA